MKQIDILGKMFEVRDCIHLLHLNTTSYAEHKALGKFYDEWIELADDFIETYQGRYQRIEGKVSINIASDYNSTEYLNECLDFIQKDAMSIVSPMYDIDLINILADMQGLINRTIYLLTLK